MVWAVVILAASYAFEYLPFARMDREIQRTIRRTGRSLGQWQGLHALFVFDEMPPVERVSNTGLLQSGVTLVEGRYGWGRYFDGRSRTFIASQSSWADAGNQFTVSLWLNIDASLANQKIVYAAAHQGDIGLQLRNRQLTFHVPPDDVAVSYEFERFDELVHIAAVVDEKAGYAALYENGREQARVEIETVNLPDHNIVFSMSRWSHSNTPFKGVLDEVAIFTRAFTPRQVDALSRRNRSLAARYWLNGYGLARVYYGIIRGIRTLGNTADAFNLFLYPGHASNADLPALNLYLSNRDLRHFLQANRLSEMTGYTPSAAAQPREVSYFFNGRPGTVSVTVHRAPPAHPAHSVRMGFILSGDDLASAFGSTRIRLVPPENRGFLQPLLETRLAQVLNLPHVENGLVRLQINGEFRGIYYFEDFESMGFFPGQAGPLHWGTTYPDDWQSLFREPERPAMSVAPIDAPLPLGKVARLALYDGLVADYRRVLLNDPFSLASSREARYQFRQLRRMLVALPQMPTDDDGYLRTLADWIKPTMFLGRNPAALFVVDDLDLNRLELSGVGIEWRSESPSVLRDDGTIIRPSIGAPPEDAFLTAILSKGAAVHERTLRFRVMPEMLEVPVFMLYAEEPLGRRRRVDALAYYHEVGSTGRHPRSFTASSWSRGGISHRGNTSHWDEKKPFNLRLDESHHILNETHTRHLFFVTGTRDMTRIRNGVSYELFRSFSSPGTVRHAPDLEWVELFFNGEYIGLYEMVNRIDRHALGFPPFDAATEHPATIVKVGIQRHPSSRHGDHSHDYELARGALLRIRENENPFDVLATHLDVGNAIDYHLLLNVIEGMDNMTANYILARDEGAGQRYEYIAWDMKRTFRGGTHRYVHYWMRHASRTDEFDALLRTRWADVRDSVAAPETLLQYVNEVEARLTPYMKWEYERWPTYVDRMYGEYVQELRENLQRRLALIEERYGVEEITD